MIINVIRTALLNFRSDRGAILLTFILPMVFFSIFAFIFGGTRNTSKVKVAVVDLDQSQQSKRFLEALDAEGSLELVMSAKGATEDNPFTLDTATAAVRAGDEPVALVVPEGFGSTQFEFDGSGNRPTLHVLSDSSDLVAPQILQGLIQKVFLTSTPSEAARAGVKLFRQWAGGLSPKQETSIEANVQLLEQMQSLSGSRSQSSPVSVDIRDVVGEKKHNPVVAFYAAGIGVMFLLFTSAAAGGALLEEVESGTLDRILSSRISMTSLLVGKLLYLALVGVFQLTLMFVWGAVAFKLELWSHLPGFFLMAIATSLAVSSFGLLLASVCRTRAQLSAFSTLVILIISAFGGSMFPRFLMPESVKRVSLIFFNSWALDGFLKVFWRESPLSGLAPEVTVLLGCSLFFFIVARRMATRWELQ
ncbi:MAG: ABC transporter permease [Acidobacteriota bacterium]